MPVGAYAASQKIMAHISPDGGVYQAGTLSGNPVAMAAGAAQLKCCLENDFYPNLEKKTATFVDDLNRIATAKSFPVKVISKASIFWMAFSEKENIRQAADIEASSMERFNVMYNQLLEKGIYLGPSGYEVGFVSAAHSNADLKNVATIIEECWEHIFR